MFGRELLRLKRRRVRDHQAGTLGWAARNVAHEAGTLGLLATALTLTTGNAVGVVKRSHLVRLAYKRMKGLRSDELTILARDYFQEVLRHRIYPQARAEMERHREEGRRVVIVSTGMQLVIEPVCEELPVDDVIAVHLVAPKGVLNGDVIGPLWGKDKAQAVRDYAHARGVSLPKSYAYSDHYSDLQFLQLVGHPVAVNPDFRLHVHARRREWTVAKWTHQVLD